MERFEIEQTYDLDTLTALCRAARKTARRWGRVIRGVFWGIFAIGVALTALLLCWRIPPEPWLFVILAAMLALLLAEDRLNGWLALRQLLPGTAHSVTVFNEDAYLVTADSMEMKHFYENITSLCETTDYFVFFLGARHGQAFEKSGFVTGAPDGFRAFIEKKTGKSFRGV